MIKIEATHNSPEIIFDKECDLLTISGNSYSNNPNNLFEFLIEWAKKPELEAGKKFKVEIKIDYCSSSSLQVLNHLVCLLNKNLNGRIDFFFVVDSENDEDGQQTIDEICYNSNIIPIINFT